LRLLLVVPSYPWAARSFAGIFNQRSAIALRELGADVEVLSPRPYSPPLLGKFNARWNAYSQIPRFQEEAGMAIHRPTYLQFPGVASTFWIERIAVGPCRRVAVERHRRARFDAILSFDLLGAGCLTWQLGRSLGVPSAGWATGGDIRVDPAKPAGRTVGRALRNLDLVFYQSGELRRISARLLGVEEPDLDRRRHIVLSRGILEPPAGDWQETRSRTRMQLGLREDHMAVFSLGRISAEKGIDELLGVARNLGDRQDVRFVLVGGTPGFDRSDEIRRSIESDPRLQARVQLLPACAPEDVWKYLAAADIFAFSSHKEGMPNSLLEAMAMELPVVAFAIPAVEEIDGGTGALVKVPPFEVEAFAVAIRRLAEASDERRRRGREARAIVQKRFLGRRNMAIALERIQERALMDRNDPSRPGSTLTERRAG
jgi:glycosyltransferase involved in cell wall biosynthesis